LPTISWRCEKRKHEDHRDRQCRPGRICGLPTNGENPSPWEGHQEIEQERIAVANMENAMLALLRTLPDALKNLKIGDVHLGDPSIVALLQRFASGMNHGGLRYPQGEK
jgi:hypothetical protein